MKVQVTDLFFHLGTLILHEYQSQLKIEIINFILRTLLIYIINCQLLCRLIQPQHELCLSLPTDADTCRMISTLSFVADSLQLWPASQFSSPSIYFLSALIILCSNEISCDNQDHFGLHPLTVNSFAHSITYSLAFPIQSTSNRKR